MNPEKLKIGIVGCGYWGPKIARNMHDLPGADLVMVADIKDQRLREFRSLYPDVATTKNYQELLASNIDAIIIATPVHTHYELTKDALNANKHVLVEKPITASIAQGRELVRLAENKNLTLMVGHTFEYNPAVEKMREVIQSGLLGEIYYINAVRVNLGLIQPDINVMWDLAPHDLSIIRFILKSEPVSVRASGGIYVNKASGLHEVVYLGMKFDNDVMANLRVSWLDPVKQRQLTIVGSKKMLVYDDIADDKVKVFDKGVDVPPHSITENDFHASYRHGEEATLDIDWVEPLRKECEHFLDCIRKGEKPRSDGYAGLAVIHILEAAQRSLLNQGETNQIVPFLLRD